MNTSQLLLVSSLGLGVNLFGMFAIGGHHHHVRIFPSLKSTRSLLRIGCYRVIPTPMDILMWRNRIRMVVTAILQCLRHTRQTTITPTPIHTHMSIYLLLDTLPSYE